MRGAHLSGSRRPISTASRSGFLMCDGVLVDGPMSLSSLLGRVSTLSSGAQTPAALDHSRSCSLTARQRTLRGLPSSAYRDHLVTADGRYARHLGFFGA